MTITGGKTSDNGGGIYNDNSSTLTVNNSIITDSIYRNSGTIQGSNNLSSYTAWSSGSNNIVYNPTKELFEDDANGDYRILPGSQAYNTGSNELALAAGLNYDSTDGAGMPRFYDGVIDIGAYECYIVSTPIALNKVITGNLTAENQYTQFYSFAVDGQTTISFSLLQGDRNGLSVKLYGSGGSVFLIIKSGELTRLEAGTYYLQVQPATINTEQAYTFRVNNVEVLSVGVASSGVMPASQYTKLYQVTTTETTILQLSLDAETSTARNEIYIKKDSVPTRSDYDYFSANGTPDESLILDNASVGTYYVLVYSDYCPTMSNYTLTVNLVGIVLDDYTQTGIGTDTLEFTISGAGFDDSTVVYAVNTETNEATVAVSSKVAANGQLVAQFAKTLPTGNYTIRLVKGTNTANSTKTFTYSGLYVNEPIDLTTKLVVPNGLYAISYRESMSTLYVEYTNNSEFTIAAPLLHLVVKNRYGEENAVMTLDANRAVQSIPRSTTTMPDGFYSDLYIIGNGSLPGVLQPGETAKIPVYWRGWLGRMEEVTFSLEVIAQDNETTVNWIDVLFPTLSEQEKTDCDVYLQYMQNQLGNTWGEYVTKLAQAVTLSYLQTNERATDMTIAQNNLFDSLDQSFVDLNPTEIIPEQAPANPFPEMPWEESSNSTVLERNSIYSNEILGSSGYGEENWITGSETLAYQINYENDSTATTPAQRVDVEMYLDEDLDWSTFQFTGFGWADVFESIADGTYTINKIIETTVVPLNGTEKISIFVEVTAGIDLLSGRVWASFQSLQYTDLVGTLEEAVLLAPMDVNVGFLLPSIKGEDDKNVDSRGDGFLTYVVKSKSDLASNTAITSVADIQFDYGEIIATNQIDPHDPTKGLDPAKEVPLTIDKSLPTAEITSARLQDVNTILLNWNGTDAHSGVAAYSIYVSIDGAEEKLWKTFDSTVTQAAFNEVSLGQTYSFSVSATDNVGWMGDVVSFSSPVSLLTELTTTVQKEHNIYSSANSTDTIPTSETSITDWDTFYIEFWSEEIVELQANQSAFATLNYNPNLFVLDTTQTIYCPNGINGVFSESKTELNGTITVGVTFSVGTEDYVAPGANTFWGSVQLTPNTNEGAGVEDVSTSESLGFVNNVAISTTVEAFPFDLQKDDVVNLDDFVQFALLFHKQLDNYEVGSEQFNKVKQADFNGNGSVELEDFVDFALNFAKQKSSEQAQKQGSEMPLASSPVVSATPAPVIRIEEEASYTVLTDNTNINESVLNVEKQEASNVILLSHNTLLATPPIQLYPVKPIQSAPIVCEETKTVLVRRALDEVLSDEWEDYDFIETESEDISLAVVLEEFDWTI